MQETQETQIQSMDQKDPLEQEMAPKSNILAQRISRTEEPGELQSMGHKELDTTERLNTHTVGKVIYKEDIEFTSFLPTSDFSISSNM